MTLEPIAGRLRTWTTRWRPVLPAVRCRDHRLDRLRRAAARAAALLHPAGRRPGHPRRRHRRLAGSPTDRRADLRLGRRPDPASPAHGLRPRPDRRVPLPFRSSSTVAVAFLVLRALAGLATSIYDPAARGVLMDATPADRHGEAFGWYSAAQMSGLLLGPGHRRHRGEPVRRYRLRVPVRCRDRARLGGRRRADRPRRPAAEPGPAAPGHRPVRLPPRLPADRGWPGPGGIAGADDRERPGRRLAGLPTRPRRLRNRLLGSAVITNATDNFGAGTYDTIWSIYLTSKGATLGLVSLTFTMFAVPVLVVGPFAGRVVDRRGAMPFIVIGMVVISVAAFLYTILPDPVWAVPVILFDATGFALLNPAVYAVVGRGSPDGRTSTAQGIFGAAGTLGFVVSALIAGHPGRDRPSLPVLPVRRRDPGGTRSHPAGRGQIDPGDRARSAPGRARRGHGRPGRMSPPGPAVSARPVVARRPRRGRPDGPPAGRLSHLAAVLRVHAAATARARRCGGRRRADLAARLDPRRPARPRPDRHPVRQGAPAGRSRSRPVRRPAAGRRSSSSGTRPAASSPVSSRRRNRSPAGGSTARPGSGRS